MNSAELETEENFDLFEEESTEEVVDEVEEESEESLEAEEDNDEEEVLVTIGDEEHEEDEDEQSADWVKTVRKQYKEEKKKRRELEKQLEQLTKKEAEPAEIKLPPKPTLAESDYDTEAYEQKLEQWVEQKKQYDAQKQTLQQRQEAEKQKWSMKLQRYNEGKQTSNLKDFEDAEEAVIETLTIDQQNVLLAGAENPTYLVYALGKSKKLLAELAAIEDPIEYAFKLAKVEAQMKVRKTTPAKPLKRVKGAAPVSGSVDSHLERLRAEAEKTGDYTKVMQYKKQKRG